MIARESGLQVGQVPPAGERQFTVIGLADLAPSDLLLADIATVQGNTTGLTRIQLKLTEAGSLPLTSLLATRIEIRVFCQSTSGFWANDRGV